MIIPDYFRNYECKYTITDMDTSEIIHQDIIIAPRIIHENQFLSLVRKAVQVKRHLQVMISRYEHVDDRDDSLLFNIVYQNY